MKKILVLSVLFVVMSMAVTAQLTDTKWKSMMDVPNPTEILMQFKTDTVTVVATADGTLVETMSYSVSKDTLKLTKLSGMSPCGETVVGLYRVEIKDEKLMITPISDDCLERLSAFKPEPWIKEKL